MRKDRSDISLDPLLRQLAALKNQSALDVVTRTGRAVVEYLYGGDCEAWRQRPRGASDYHRLEQSAELPIKPAELYRALRIYEIVHRQPTLLGGHLTVSHFLCVLAASPSAQDRLLRAAKENCWTVRRLRREVGGVDTLGASTGRPRVPAILKTLQGPLASNEAFEDLEALLAVDRGTAKELMEICQRTKNAMVQIERLLLSADRAGQQARVLVVDGDQTFAMRARRELQKHVKSVWLANSCSEALVRIDGNVSCAAINVALPDGSGIELSAALRRRYPRLACVFTVGAEASAPSAVIDGRDIVVPRTSGLRHLSVAVLKALPPDDSAAAPPLAV